MPLSEIRELQNTYLALWHITETPEELTQKLTEIAPKDFLPESFRSEVRQKQWLTARLLVYLLVEKFTNQSAILLSDDKGKPYFADLPYKVSISHTAQTVAVIISDKYEVGIDIETIKPKVLQVKHKFMSGAELAHAEDILEKVLICWSTKETLYKLYGSQQVSFKEHIFINPFALTPVGSLEAGIQVSDFKKIYPVHFEIRSAYILTYCIDI